ncbi:hypothetical protein FALCPG4_012104 [Fusarium falciforme]
MMIVYRYCRDDRSVSVRASYCRDPLGRGISCSFETHLVEANVLGLLTEALTAEVEVVLADKTSLVLADAATEQENVSIFSFEAGIVIEDSPRRLGILASGEEGDKSYQLREPLP